MPTLKEREREAMDLAGRTREDLAGEILELKALVQDLARDVAASVVVLEACDPAIRCRAERALLARAQELAPSGHELVRKVLGP